MNKKRRIRERRQFRVYGAEEFQSVIKRERNRADRDGSGFSVIGFYGSNGTRFRSLADTVIRVVETRLRMPDEIGWFDSDRIGVLLPSTDEEGAVKLASDIQRALSDETTDVAFSVCSYPGVNGGCRPDERLTRRDEPDERFERKASEKVEAKEWIALREKVQASFVEQVPAWKRPLDIIGSLFAFVVFSPVFLFLSVYIKIVSPGPILFKQERVGLGARAFTFLKFRTMKPMNNVDVHRKHLKSLIGNSDVPMQKLDTSSDSRIIFGGRIIRKLGLDELPQFLNILEGSMSMVGLRPCIPYEAEEYLRWHKHRFDVLPGLTGLWQVSGKNRLSFKEMIRLDIAYGRRMSFWLDIKILLLTVPALISYALEAAGNRVRERVGACGGGGDGAPATGGERLKTRR